MTKHTRVPDKQRRRFLRGSLAAATGAVAASTVAGSSLASLAGPGADVEQEEGYRLTKHIADYYKSAAV